MKRKNCTQCKEYTQHQTVKIKASRVQTCNG